MSGQRSPAADGAADADEGATAVVLAGAIAVAAAAMCPGAIAVAVAATSAGLARAGSPARAQDRRCSSPLRTGRPVPTRSGRSLA